jgi:hypothetical protein
MKTGVLPAAPALSLSKGLLAALLLGLTACTYDFPLTDRPTRDIDPRLPGDWVATDEDGKEVSLHVRRYDGTTYVIALDDDLYRAFHSDFADTAFVSVQSLQSHRYARPYTLFRWQLSADGSRLTLESISSTIVPEDIGDRAALQALIRANLANPKLFNEALVFSRKE